MNEESAPAVALSGIDFPRTSASRPTIDILDGDYRCRFAMDVEDLRAVLRLRYRVFNVELGEGLDSSHGSGLDLDPYDPHCDHLMVIHVPSDRVIGTYRMQTAAMARLGNGFYSADEFELESWPAEILDRCCEVGRACIEADHRRRRVLLLLWRGLGSYVLHNEMRYFFGCCSLTSQDPFDAARMAEYLRRHGHAHPTLDLQPREQYDCQEMELATDGWEQLKVPTLFRTYLRYGARICGRPAIDRAFKTIDFLALLDLDEMDPDRILRQFEVDLRSRS